MARPKCLDKNCSRRWKGRLRDAYALGCSDQTAGVVGKTSSRRNFLKAVPPRDGRLGEIIHVHTMSAILDGYATEPATDRSNRNPCCSNCNGTEGKELFIKRMLHFATSQIPIIDTGCMT